MRKLSLFLICTFTYLGIQAQLSGTKMIPGDYPTLVDAITALNTQGVGAGGVTLQIGANQSLSATLQIGSATLSVGAAASTQANPITINGGNFTINAAFAGTRAGSLTSGANDAVIVVNGTDYITIKNCVFTEQATNTTATTAIENAIAFYNRNATTPFDGVQFATVENCTFNLSKAATAGSAVLAGSFIWTGTTSLGWAAFGTTPGDMHRYIDVKNNTFTGSYNHVTYRGATTVNGRALSVTGNTFTNIGGAGTTAYGVYALYLDSMIVNNNTFTFSSTHTTTLYGAFASTNCGGRQEFNGNTVTLRSNTTTSTTAGASYTSIGADRQMNNNIINFGAFPALTTGTIYGLQGTYSGGNNNITLEMNGNTVSGQAIGSTTATTASIYFFANGASTGTNRKVTMNNNTITNNTRVGGGTLYAISAGTADSAIAMDNTINNFTWTNNSTSSSANFYGVYGLGSPLAQRFNNNTVANVTITGSSTSTAGTMRGIQSSTVAAGTAAIYSNTVNNLSYGSGTNTGGVTGIFVSISSPNNIYKNNVYNLSANQAAGLVTGINASSGTTNNVYNNMVSGLTTPNATGTNAVIGINISGGTNANVLFNTVYPSSAGDLTSTGATFGGSALYVSSTVNTVAKNNIFNITGTATTGYFAAVKRSAGTANTNPTNLSLSNNIYNSSYIYGETLTEATATNLYYVSGGAFGTADPDFNTACGLFKSWKGDAGSFTESNLTGSNGVYAPSGSSYAEGGASTAITPTVLDDYNSVTRSVTTPDMGALEFAGTLNDASGPAISYTAIGTQNCNNAPSLTATITDATGVNTTAGTKPRLYFKKNSEANTLGANNSSANGWKYVEATNASSPFTFTLNYSLLTSTALPGDSIEYFVVAQDIVSTPNVGGSSVAFAPGFCPTSAALTGPAFPVSNFLKFGIKQTPTVTVTTSPTSVCANNDATLSVAIAGTGNLTVGTGTLTSSTYTPYYGSTTAARRIQYFFSATELTTLGLRQGDITELSFDIASVPTAFTISDFSIKMGHTTATTLTGTFSSDATTTVLPAGSYTPVVGLNTHTLSTPFTWDGTSNIIIEACHGVTGVASLTTARYTSGLPSGISVYTTNAAGCAQTTGTTTTIRANITFRGQLNQNNSFTTFTWNDGTNNVGSNNDTIVVQPSFPMGNTMTYSVTATDAIGCSFGGNVVVNKNLTAPTGTAAADKLNICYADSIVLSAAITGGCPPYNYSWSNGTTVVGTAASIKAYPTANTTYTLTVTDNSMQTFSPTAISVNVNSPAPLTTTPASRCGTGTVTLTATKNPTDSLVWYAAATGGVPVGTGTSFTTPAISSTTNYYAATYVPQPNTVVTQGAGATTSATYSNPFYSAWSNNHTQHLITAEELRQSGLVAGNINSVALNVTAAGTLPMLDLSVKIGTTSETALTAFVNNAGFSTVYTSASLLPTTGINTLTFTAPFNWDGVSNLVLEFCHGNGASTATMSRTVLADATSYVSSIKAQISAATPASTICSDVTSQIVTYSVRPQFIFNGVGKCEGPRIPVAATVTTAPALTSVANDTICNNNSKLLNVTSTLGDFDNYSWAPTTGLFTDAAGTTPYTGGNASSVYVKNATAGTTNYVVTGTNSTGAQCANTDTVVVRVMPNPTIVATPQEICVSGSTTLSLSASTGYTSNSFQWQTSPDGMSYTDIPTATNATYATPTLTTTTYYRMVIKDASGNACSNLPIDTIVVNNPTITGTTPASRCGTGTLNLAATTSGGSSAKWYAASTGGTALYTGNTFTTPVISSTTTYYVAASSGSSSTNMGRLAPQAGAGTSLSTYGQVITITEPVTLNSVDVISAGGTSITITLYNSDGTSLLQNAGATSVVANSTQTIALNWVLSPGTYRLMATGMTGNFIRENSTVTYPIALGSIGQVNGFVSTLTGSVTTSASYYWFYNMLISTGCESARTAVTATVSNAAAITTVANDTICNNASKLLNVTSTIGDYETYTWAPTTGLFIDAAGTTPYTGGNATSVYVKNTTAGTTNYVVTGSNSTGAQCANTDTIVVRVMPNPTINASPEEICRTGYSTLTLSATTGYTANSLQWQTSPDGMSYTDIPSATNTTYTTPTITSTTYYKTVIKDASGTVCSTAPVKTITVNNPLITGTTPGSRCGTGAVIISATANAGADVQWFANSSGGTPLFTGSTFTTPVISSTTTYYAAASKGGGTASVGANSPSIGTADGSTIVIGTQRMNFDVLAPFRLLTVTIYPTAPIGSAFTIVIQNSAATEIFNSGSILTTVTGGTTPQVVTLNADLVPGTGYRIGMGVNPGLIRNSTGAVYPYTVPGVLSITGNSFSTVYYYWFYNWQISTGCESTTRTAVTATIDNSMGCVPFPVNLLSFKGEKNGNINALEWKTATEINNAGFELQRSADGNTFSAVTFIASKATNGNSTGVLTYQFDDTKPINGNNYYRLKQMDKDGKSTYSNVVLIRGNRMNQLVVSNLYPNPTKKDATLILNSPATDKVSIVITDVTGRVVFQKAASLITGDNLIQLPISQLRSGTYLVKCLCSNGCETAIKKLIKE